MTRDATAGARWRRRQRSARLALACCSLRQEETGGRLGNQWAGREKTPAESRDGE